MKFPPGTYKHTKPNPKCAVASISWAGSDRPPKCHECGRPMTKKVVRVPAGKSSGGFDRAAADEHIAAERHRRLHRKQKTPGRYGSFHE